MGRMIAEKVKGMNWKSKISLILIFALMFSTFIHQGLYRPGSVQAAIAVPQAWTVLRNATGDPGTVTGYTVPAGTDRMLVVILSRVTSGNAPQTCSVTYGTKAMTKVTGAHDEGSNTRQHTWIFYMDDNVTTGLRSTSNTSFVFTCSGGTVQKSAAFAQVLTGVDQSGSPIRSAQNYNSGATTGNTTPTFATPLSITDGDYSVGILMHTRTGSTTIRTHTAGANWTPFVQNVTEATTVGTRYSVANRNITTAGSETAIGTESNANTAPVSMSAISIKPAADTQAPTVTGFGATTPTNNLNIPIPTFTATDNTGVTGYKITTSSTAPLAGDAGWTGTAPVAFTVGSSGNYTLYPWAKDAAGNVSAVYGSPVAVVVDVTAPSYTWNTPASGAYFKDAGTISVDATITETGVGITDGITCNAKIDGGTGSFVGFATYSAGTGKCTGTLTLNNPSGLSEGAHSLTLQLADNAGNTTESAARTVNIDNVAPGLPSNSCPGSNCTTYTPADEATGQLLDVALQSATAPDSGSGNVQYYFQVNDTETYDQNSGWIAGTSFAPPSLQFGTTYTWKVKARDAAGNETAYTTPRSFSTAAQCFRNEPSLTFIGATISTVTAPSGTANYTLRVINNDIGGCPGTVFSLSTSEIQDDGDNFENTPKLNGSAPPLSTNSLAPGGYQDITVGVTARAGSTAGRARNRVTSAADAYHPIINSSAVTTNLNVATCTANAPQIAIGPDAGNVAIGGTLTYSISLKNTDVGASCTAVTYAVSIVSENPATPNADFNASTLTYSAQSGNSVNVTLNKGQTDNIVLTVSAKTGATNGNVEVTTIGVTAAGHASPSNSNATSTVGNVLLHNSVNINSTKWSTNGGWGIPGGKYGEFICNTCHVLDGTTSNIKKVLQTIATPDETNGLIPGDSMPIVFTKVTGNPGDSGVMGDDSSLLTTSPRTTTDRVCEICHTYDASGANGVRVHAFNSQAYTVDSDGATPTSSNHKNFNAKDCVSCHKHNIGFRPPTCYTCHGTAPSGVPTNAGNLASYAGMNTGSTTAGAHVRHVTDMGIACSMCHANYSMPQESGVKPGYLDISIGINAWGTAGTYSGQLNLSYNNQLGTGGLVCANVYCHGSTIGGSNAVWSSTVGCGSCHNATAANPPAGNSHLIHAGDNTGAGQLNILCSDCHGAYGAGPAGHVDGKVEWALNTGAAKFGANAKYWTSSAGASSGPAPSSPYGSCSSIYCHGSGTPTWGGSSLACNGCHGASNNGDLSASGTTGHAIHYATATNATGISQASNFASGYVYSCASCHPANQHADGASTANSDADIGGTRLTWYTAGGSASIDPKNFRYTNGTCSNNSCHSDGRGGPAKSAVTWVGAKTSPNCGVCHNKVGDASPSWSTPHSVHINTYSANTNFNCKACHSVTAASNTATNDTQAARTQHPDGSKNVDIDTFSGGSYVGGTGCSATYCHSQGTNIGAGPYTQLATQTWSGGVTCASCHTGGTTTGPTYPSGSPKTNSHNRHTNVFTFVCVDCHSSTVNGSNAITDTTKHVNKSYDVSGARITTYTYAADGGTCATACHGTTNTPKWGGTSLACDGCHNASNSGLSSRHDIHYNSASVATAINSTNANTGSAYVFGCGNCHPSATHVQGAVSGVQDAQVSGSKMTWYTAAGTNLTDAKGFKYTNYGACGTVCHTKDGVTVGSAVVAANWGGAATGGCGVCHKTAGDATPNWSTAHSKHVNTYSANTNISCNSCHSGTAAGNTALQATAAARNQHPDGVKNVAFNGWSSGAGASWSGTQCSNTYCHSAGTSLNGGTHGAIAWNTTFGCTGCHPTTALSTGAHAAHVNDTGNKVGFNIGCAECHNATTTNGTTISGYAYHVEKNVNVRFDNGVRNKDTDLPKFNGADARTSVAAGATKAVGSAAGSCDSVYCHSSGNVNGQTAPTTYSNISWNTTIGCGGCHGDTATNRSHPVYGTGTAGSATANSHVKHVESSSLGCDFCHLGTVDTSWTTFGAATQVVSAGLHLNRVSSDVSFKSNGGKWGSYAAASKTCSATYCHGTGASPAWGTTANCGSCHDATGVALSLRHDKHYNSGTLPTQLAGGADAHTTTNYVYACLQCHPTGTHTTGPWNSMADAQLNGAKMTWYTVGSSNTTDAQGYKYSVTGTCGTVCHTKDGATAGSAIQVFNWATVTTGGGTCGICHNKAGDVAPVWSTVHTKHVNTYTANTNITCNSCHSGTAASNTALQATSAARDQHPNAVKNVAFNGWSSGAGANWSGTQCSNTYCHSAGTSATAGTHAAIAWNTTFGCTGCHGGAANWTTSGATAGTGAHWRHVVSRGYSCNICHNATASSNTVVNGYSNHVDKNATIQINSSYSTIGTSYNGQQAGWSTIYQKGVGTASGSCNVTTCHGGVSMAWNTIAVNAQCVKCHGVTGTTDAQYAAENKTAAPGWNTVGINTSGTVGAITNNVSNNGKVGAHDSHLRSPKGYSGGIACRDCHNVTALGDAGHMDGSTTLDWSSLARNRSLATSWSTAALTPTYTGGACSVNYCHGYSAWTSVRGTGWTSNVGWTSNAYLSNPAAAKNAADCNKCHASPPTASTKYDHSAAAMPSGLATNCAQCHNHNGTGAEHINGILYGAGSCNSCHWYDTTETGAWTTSAKPAGGTYDSQSGALWNSTNAWGAHAKHIAHLKTRYGVTLNATSDAFGGSQFNSVCGFCHTNSTGNHITVNTRQITWNTTTHQFGASSLNWNTVSRSCTNLDCHYKASPVW